MSLDSILRKTVVITALAFPSCAPLTTADVVNTGVNTTLGFVPGLSLAQRAGLIATSGLSDAVSKHEIAQESAPNITVNTNGNQPPQPIINSATVWSLKLEDVDTYENKMAFSYNLGNEYSGNNFEIFIMNNNASDLRRITFTKEDFQDRCPKWSPDGKKIAFLREYKKSPYEQGPFKRPVYATDLEKERGTPREIYILDLEKTVLQGYRLPPQSNFTGNTHPRGSGIHTYITLSGWNSDSKSLNLKILGIYDIFGKDAPHHQLDLTTMEVYASNYPKTLLGKASPINN